MDIVAAIKRFIKRLVPKERCSKRGVFQKALKDKYGLEVGGPSVVFCNDGILPLYRSIKSLDVCNFSEETIWEGTLKEGYNYRYEESKPAGFQYILDAVNLTSIEDCKYDFVAMSHTLEHIANPIKALKEWLRVIKNDGYLLVLIPHRDVTFDHNRQVTTLSHLISDYNNSLGEDDLSHLNEILKLHDLSRDIQAGDFESFRARSLDNSKNRCLHHHVFDTNSVLQLFNYLNLQICAIDLMKPFHIIVLGKKLAKGKLAENSEFLDSNAKWRKSSPFLSDRLK